MLGLDRTIKPVASSRLHYLTVGALHAPILLRLKVYLPRQRRSWALRNVFHLDLKTTDDLLRLLTVHVSPESLGRGLLGNI